MSGTQCTISELIAEFSVGGAGGVSRTTFFNAVQTFAQLTFAPQPTGQFWVATTGNDSAAGTKAAPFLTIAKAVSVATAGQTIYLRGGTYSIVASVAFTASNNNVTIQAWPGETPIVDGGGTVDAMFSVVSVVGLTVGPGIQLQNSLTTSPFYGAIQVVTSQNCKFIGNFITNAYNGIFLINSSWNKIQGNKITNTFGVGGVQSAGGNNNTIDSNIIDTTTSLLGGTGTVGAGVYVTNGAGNQITHNIVRNCIGCAIVAEASGTNGACNGTVIQNNYCPNNITSTATNIDCGVIYMWNGACQLDNDTLIDNNYAECLQTSTSIEGVCIYLDNNVSGVTVTNNVCDIESVGVLIHGGMNNTFKNNIINMNSAVSGNQSAGIMQNSTGFTGGSMTNNLLSGNLIYSSAVTAPANVWYGVSSPVCTITGNYYFNSHSQTMTNVGGSGASDAAPITGANPEFVVAPPTNSTGTPPSLYDMEGGNLPGFDGFVPINQGTWGLRANIIHWPTGWA